MAHELYRVGEVARLARVTVRTLHHYDAIGLLTPSERSPSGYRLYSEDDLLRLQQIHISRALGLSLEAIRATLDDPDFDRRAALERQRAEIEATIERSRSMLAAIDAALARIQRPTQPTRPGETTMSETQTDPSTLFEGFDPAEHDDEARERWGDTEAFRESKRRMGKHSPAEMAALKAEVEAIEAGFAAALQAGHASDSAQAVELAEAHRRHIDRWFYPCSPAMHRSLGAMYTADARFTAHYEKRAENLAAYVAEAIEANSAGRG